MNSITIDTKALSKTVSDFKQYIDTLGIVGLKLIKAIEINKEMKNK